MEMQVRLLGTGDFAKDRKLIRSKFGEPKSEYSDYDAWVMHYIGNPHEMLYWLLDECNLPSVEGVYVVR